MAINTPFQKRYVLFSERVYQFPPDGSTGFPSPFPVEYNAQKYEQECPDEYQEDILRMFAQPSVYFLRHIIHIKALFHKLFVRCS